MKKLNRKGFTLVELLAVIIILAIVVGITIPAVLNTINSSRKQAAQTAADVAAKWIAEQYTIASVSSGDVSGAYKDYCQIDGSGCANTTITVSSASDIQKAFLEGAGFKLADVDSLVVTLNTGDQGKACVTLTPSTTGAYYVNNDSAATYESCSNL